MSAGPGTDFFALSATGPSGGGLRDDRLIAGSVLFSVYVLDAELVTIPLTEERPSAVFDALTLGVVNDRLFINGAAVPAGVTECNDPVLLVVAMALAVPVVSAHGVRPKAVEFVPVGGIPRTTSGKPRRFAARSRHLDGVR